MNTKFTTEPTTYSNNSETDITITSKEITFEASSATTVRTTKSSGSSGDATGKSSVNDVSGIQKEEANTLKGPLTSLLENTALVKPINDNTTSMIIENTTTVSIANTLQQNTETMTITLTTDTPRRNTTITHENTLDTFERLKVESFEAMMEKASTVQNSSINNASRSASLTNVELLTTPRPSFIPNSFVTFQPKVIQLAKRLVINNSSLEKPAN